jgi:DNA-directed DNA polymerase III PolC
LYVELQKHRAQDEALAVGSFLLAKRLNLPVVATQDVYYQSPEQAELQGLLAAIRRNQSVQDVPSEALALPNSYFSTPAEMVERFANFPQALSITYEIAERCQLELPLGVQHYPQFSLPPGSSAIQVLRGKAEEGAQRLYEQVTPAIQSRLDHELAVIEESGYTSLFLVMEEIIQYARQKGVPVSSRGSAASSLVAHSLGITSPDPLRLNLYFERFLNPARITPPDIDTDLCSRRRDDVIRFVYERYGQDRVAMVCTINRFRRRSALREVAKAYGLPAAKIKDMADALPYRWRGPPQRNSKKESPFAGLAEHYSSPLQQKIFRDASALLGLPRHLSIHPGGVVIAPGLLTDLVPVQLATKGVIITQFDLDSIERMGLVKIDLLGIRGLTVLGDVAQELFTVQQGKFGNPLDVLEAIPEDDEITADMVQNGGTIGCFQIESPGMRATLKEVNARSVDDIMVALALYRPGPLTGGLKDAFVQRHRGEAQVTHLHPSLAPLLEDTYGVILYQEQVLRIAHELAGLSLADADLLRRAMSHFDPGEQMRTLKEKFVAGAYHHSGVPEEVAERVWELMAAFAGYGFPKAHAASYAQIAWRAAWCKAHHPAIFMAAVLANWGGYYGQRVYLMEARRMGLTIRPPHVNYSQREFSVSYIDQEPLLFMGLDQVQDLTRRTQSSILEQRPFHSWQDFLARVDPRPVEAQNLVKAGSLDGFGAAPSLLNQLERGGWRGGQLSLFVPAEGDLEDWSLEQKMAAQEGVLGVGVIAHPLELVAEQIQALEALNTVQAAARLGQRVQVAGMRQIWRRFRTARGDYLYYMSMEDLEGILDVVIYADVYRRYRGELSDPGPYLIEGILELDSNSGEPYIRAEKIERLTPAR